MEAGRGLLLRAPEEAAHLLALRLLDAAAAAHARLAGPDDDEALHDFRVAVRRLRSTLRAYRPLLSGSLSKKLERRLKRLGRATAEGRDAEVQLAWLDGQRPEVTPHQRAGLAWLEKRLEERRRRGYARAAGHLAEDFAPLAAELRRRLGIYRAEVRLEGNAPPPSFALAAASVLRAAAEALSARLAGVSTAGDVEGAHAARIRGKRLRYLLEPLADEVEPARALVKRLKGLQDLLGELHDAHLLEAELGKAAEEAAAERARALLAAALEDGGEAPARSRGRTTQPGLLALGRRNRARRDALFGRLHAEWLEGRSAPFVAGLEDLAARLEQAAAAGEGTTA